VNVQSAFLSVSKKGRGKMALATGGRPGERQATRAGDNTGDSPATPDDLQAAF